MNLTNITSPMTIIALLAAIVETSALASLPFLDPESQGIYTWFLVGFPPFLTVLFFITLNFNAKALFSPNPANDPQMQRSLQPRARTTAPVVESETESQDNKVILLGDLLFCSVAESELQKSIDTLQQQHGLQARLITCNKDNPTDLLFSL